MKKNSSFLRITIFSGLILFALAIMVLLIFYFVNNSGTRLQRMQDNFARALREYDLYASYVPGMERDLKKLESDLDKLEKMAISLESWLSVLKRRRALTQVYPESFENYKNSVYRARNIYPASPSLTALAAEIHTKGSAITPYSEEELRNMLPSLTGYEYNNLLLSLHVLLGDFRNPLRAQIIPSYLSTDGTESVTINLILLKILKSDISGANSDIQSMFYNVIAPSDEGLRFIAEFHYDYGDMERSAEIFTRINDEKALSRASDALYLAGYTDSARNMWNILAQRREDTEAAEKILEKSLYNLGVTSDITEESISYFERLINIYTPEVSEYKQFGLIQYSRRLELPYALDVLHKTQGLDPKNYPFIDLEILRRQTANWELRRQIAESWLLIDRHTGFDDLYRWVSWLFLFQRNFSENQILLDRALNLNFVSQENNKWWFTIHSAIQAMHDGDLEKADELLKQIPNNQRVWVVFANLGRILEGQRRFSLSLEQYEIAMQHNPPPKTAARVQIRMARCFIALERVREARLAYEAALQLDPGNLIARMELDRLIY